MMRGAKNQYEKWSEEKGSDPISYAPGEPHDRFVGTLREPGRVQIGDADGSGDGRADNAGEQDELKDALRGVEHLDSTGKLVNQICAGKHGNRFANGDGYGSLQGCGGRFTNQERGDEKRGPDPIAEKNQGRDCNTRGWPNRRDWRMEIGNP